MEKFITCQVPMLSFPFVIGILQTKMNKHLLSEHPKANVKLRL